MSTPAKPTFSPPPPNPSSKINIPQQQQTPQPHSNVAEEHDENFFYGKDNPMARRFPEETLFEETDDLTESTVSSAIFTRSHTPQQVSSFFPLTAVLFFQPLLFA
jgi:hypothetical protein